MRERCDFSLQRQIFFTKGMKNHDIQLKLLSFYIPLFFDMDKAQPDTIRVRMKHALKLSSLPIRDLTTLESAMRVATHWAHT
ncbi:hypothetical protein HNR55_003206 [Acetobacter lovaniensis]|jgi:hypothetical protein|uniref:Uncharacterized protein n=1 Tax=Acetobacter lovaniensis TaxID=104100 RepID=A0A841QJW5_9PROT|nr:hypothetical protein [Acetobacter lovaniensis]